MEYSVFCQVVSVFKGFSWLRWVPLSTALCNWRHYKEKESSKCYIHIGTDFLLDLHRRYRHTLCQFHFQSLFLTTPLFTYYDCISSFVIVRGSNFDMVTPISFSDLLVIRIGVQIETHRAGGLFPQRFPSLRGILFVPVYFTETDCSTV